ncbi:putative tumor protein p53-inducible nuclear protein 2-like [Scophthalmus maximus]|uniref:Putative tumor protein p53-inducible nuclear protein 2-like n=1 Tax=Scophthalmus maximus TaxID=52904 RepID=A0A2U9BE26_SCOMX|nr:putative tumor protein p53-inducible nuclear protein 2-like [Scophthalmus maximus]
MEAVVDTEQGTFKTNSFIIVINLLAFVHSTECSTGIKMIGKILSHLLWNTGEDFEAIDDTFEELMEFEEGEWIIVNLPEIGQLSAPEVDPLENLLIEHPSMSVYQMRCRTSGAEEEEEQGSDEDEEDTSRPVAVRQHISWRLAAWGIPLPCKIQLLAVQRARTPAERKKLSRGSLHRQNIAKLRFSPAEKRFGYFKQPCQRFYNY